MNTASRYAAEAVNRAQVAVDTLLDGRLAPRQPYLTWMRPLCKWTFEIGYQVDAEDVEWPEFDRVLETRSVLVLGVEGGHTDFSRPRHIDEIRKFLVERVGIPELPVATISEKP